MSKQKQELRSSCGIAKHLRIEWLTLEHGQQPIVSLYTHGIRVWNLNASEALKLLGWLEQERETLARLAQESGE